MSDPDWDYERVHLEIEKIKTALLLNPLPAGSAMAYIQLELKDFPRYWQGIALAMLNMGYEVGADVKEALRQKLKLEQRWSIVGLLLLLAAATIAFLLKDLNPFQKIIEAFLMALGAASFLVNLPGLLEINGVMKPNEFFHSLKVKATGGAAIFIAVFLLMSIALKMFG
jgi:hypothetical protein